MIPQIKSENFFFVIKRMKGDLSQNITETRGWAIFTRSSKKTHTVVTPRHTLATTWQRPRTA